MKKRFQLSILSFKLISGAVLFGALLCVINSYISYQEFKKQIESLYENVTRQFAETAVSYVNPERIFSWLTDGADGNWDSTNARLNEFTETAKLAYVYLTVISPDYKKRTYVFDTVNSEILDSKVIPLGYEESLLKKTPDYIENLRNIRESGKTQTYFSYKKGGGHVTTSIPVRDYTGSVIAVMSVVKSMSEIKSYKAHYLTSLITAVLIFTAVFVAIYSFSLLKGLIRPLMLIIDETSNLAAHHAELSGNLKKIKNKDELGLLAKSVEKMSHDMNNYINDLTKATTEKERLGAELCVAKKIQAEMLPRVFPPFKNHPEVELFATMAPAKEVGGDFYDFYMIDDNHFAVTVGDVSGKGVPAALFMVIAKTLLKEAAFRFTSPAEIFSHVNDILCEGNDSGLFVTCWMGILELDTGNLTFANAGHALPVIQNAEETSFLKSKPNLMLAAMSGVPYENHKTKISTGDRLFVYTDGVTEATNVRNELYGEERLLEIFKKIKSDSPEGTLAAVQASIDAFVNKAPQFDDITMLEMIFKSKRSQS